MSAYRIVTISLYDEDLARLDELVTAARAKGVRHASRSSVLRAGIARIDAAALPHELDVAWLARRAGGGTDVDPTA